MASNSLCNLCQGLNIHTILPHTGPDGSREPDYSHHASPEALFNSARNCSMCATLAQALEINGLQRGDWTGKISISNKTSYMLENRFLKRIWDEDNVPPVPKADQPPRRLYDMWVEVKDCGYVANVGLYAEEDDPLAISQDIIGRLPAKNPLDPSAIQIMKNWISSCTSSHIFCRPTTELTAVPTRILRILDKENLCLCDYDASLGQYAAISYCWGTGQPFKLVTHNMRQLRCGFPISSLSKTLQDFIKVCRVLGINFAWADATCIIQDDDSDWERESAKMGAIYRNAFVTISADAAQDSMDGFLKARPTPSVAPARFSSTCSNSMISGTIIALPLNHKAERDRTRSSVSQRGWCLQQHVLSRRTIHFRENQLSWECMTVELSEDNTPPGFWIGGLKRRLAAGRHIQKSLLYIWDSIVTDYTQRQLTHQTDFFPALAGIAQAIAPSLAADETKDYLAGLWRQNLPLNLLWKTKYGGGTPQPPYCAPSWSWASIASEIHNPWLPDDGLEYSISITSISVTPQSVHKPLGAIVSGSLTSKNCRVRRMRIQESKWIPGSYNVRDDGNWKAIGLIDFDDSKFQPPDELDSVLICVFNIPTEGILKGSIRSYFLALMPVEARISSQDRDATFRRVGTGYLWEENWYFGSEARVADLVIV